MGRFNYLMFFVSGSIARISFIFQATLAIAFSYFLLNNDSSELWCF